MGFTILNEADAFHASQAGPDKVDFDILADALKGTGVLSGCAVTPQGTPDTTVAVASGIIAVDGASQAVSSGNVDCLAADGSNPRFDLIVVDNAGVKSVEAGTADANPVFPSIPANSVVIAAVYRTAADDEISSVEIVDKRAILGSVLELYTAVATQTLTASSTITVTDGEPYRQIDSGSAITLTSEPHIAAGRNGQIVELHNVGAYDITLQDVNALGSSLMRFTADTLTIEPGGTLALVMNTVSGFWHERYLLNPQTFTPSIDTFVSDLSATREVAAASTEDTAPNFSLTYIGTPSACSIDVSAGGDPAAQWPLELPADYDALNGGTTPPTDTFYRGTAILATRIFTATATVAGVGGLEKTLTLTYINNRFIGSNVKDKTSALTEVEIEALTTALSNSKTGTFSVTGTNYIWYCYPSRLGVGIFASIDGEVAKINDRGTAVTVTNPSGYGETFQQWVTETSGVGAVTFVVSTSEPNNRIYMGPGPAGTGTDWETGDLVIANADVLALDDTADGESVVSSSVARTYTDIQIESGEYLWFVHPDRISDLATIKDGTTGFGIDGKYQANITHTNQFGYQETYRCWRSHFAAIYPSGENIVVT